MYEPCAHGAIQVYSLHHTFPLLKLKGFSVQFYLVPADDCHFDCVPSKIEHRSMGIPYPKLDIFAQSLLDILDFVALTDLVDGMDLDSEWGSQHLNLSGTHDTAWAKQKNEKMKASTPGRDFWELKEEPWNVREIWEDIVSTKHQRIRLELAEGFYATCFRRNGQEDPRLMERTYV